MILAEGSKRVDITSPVYYTTLDNKFPITVSVKAQPGDGSLIVVSQYANLLVSVEVLTKRPFLNPLVLTIGTPHLSPNHAPAIVGALLDLQIATQGDPSFHDGPAETPSVAYSK